MKRKPDNKVQRLLERLGGAREVWRQLAKQRRLVLEPMTVYRWGYNGQVPRDRIHDVIEIAKAAGITVTVDDLL